MTTKATTNDVMPVLLSSKPADARWGGKGPVKY
jgi:PepB aminopeptidase